MSQGTTLSSVTPSEPTISRPPRTEIQSNLAKLVYPYSHSPWPIWSLSAFFLGTSPVGVSNPVLAPFALRFGFGFIYLGAGYVLSTGDTKNGSGIAASWSAIYILSNQLRKPGVLKRDNTVASRLRVPQRHSLALALTGATLFSTALYGGEYLWFQNFDEEP